jgi:OmpA-OmpF porin, OOP family
MRPNTVPYFFLGLAAILAIAAVTLLFVNPSTPKQFTEILNKKPLLEADEKPAPIRTLDEPLPSEIIDESQKYPESGLSFANPIDILAQISKALENGDIETVSQLIGKRALNTENLAKLSALIADDNFQIRKPGGIIEIGELELNRAARWAIELEDREFGRDRILFDLRNEDGKWTIDKLILPPAPDELILKAILPDSLGIADAFLQAVIKQDFEFAKNFVDPVSVSDTRIAALCILFEEGDFRMRSAKPLRAMLKRDDTVGYLAHVVTPDEAHNAEFTLTLRQPPTPSNWLVTEINLDGLLADYANRIAGGDVYYSPFVKNPSGGETLALYFGFDEDSINKRTRRQLEIVVALLKSDPHKKIRLSGHTDALGTSDYNGRLSLKRASTVRDFLIAAGVPAVQIITTAEGDSQPRRPNVTETGEDYPDGRRANRRTEIYLDF